MANNIIKRVWNQGSMTPIEDLQGSAFTNENGGHTFQISGVDSNGEALALSGTVAASFLRPDQTTVGISGSVSGGVASVTLSEECYGIPGRFGLVVFLTSDGKKTAIYSCVGNVARSSTDTVAPGVVADVVDLINEIEAAVDTIPASYSALMADIAPTYSSSALYAVGDYAWYEGDLKRCIVPITVGETYTPAHWTSAVVGDDVCALKSAINSMKGGTTGQLLRKKSGTDYDVEWASVGQPTDQQVETAVNEWLDDHPEATTTVQDGSLTEGKFTSATLLALKNNFVTPQMYGAVGDGINDDTTAVQNAINYAVAHDISVVFSNGIFAVSETIVLPDKIRLVMYPMSKIIANAEIEHVVTMSATDYTYQEPVIVGLNIDGNHLATVGMKFYMISMSRTISVQGLNVINCVGDGIVFDNCQGATFMSLQSGYNGGTGVLITGCNDSKFIGISSFYNVDGCKIANRSDSSGGCYLFGVHCEANTGTGLIVDDTGMVAIYSGWLEGNHTLPLLIDNDAHVLMSGFRIVAHQQQSNAMIVNSDFAIIRDIELGAENPDFYKITLNGNSVLENISAAVTNIGSSIAAKEGNELITNADCQSTGGFSAHSYTTITYQSQEKVASGKTYSIKVVGTAAGAYIDQNVTGLSGKYRIKGKLYSDDITSIRVYFIKSGAAAIDIPNYETGKWVEFEFYANIEGDMKFGLDLRSSGTMYVAEFSVKHYEDGKISRTRIGNDYIYSDVIKPVINV